MEFGQRVVFTLTYLRMGETRVRDSGFGMDWWNWWKEVPSKQRSGLFIGYRSIQNGIQHFEDGYSTFEQKERIKVALVVPSPRHNPIYVVISSMNEYPA